MNDDSARQEPLRLHYLDGLRGFAALWVVVHHAFLEVAAVGGWLPLSWQRWTRWAWDGQIGVQVFIVLSGYCLMMPVARAGGLKGSVGDFIRRRARRILPPYYAALALTLAATAFVPGMGVAQGLRWDVTLPAFTPGALLSHLLLIQDLHPDWILKIGHTMWTIAQEWQLYFVFALVLLPLWKRAGMIVTVAAAFAVSVLLRYFPGHSFGYACPEFLFLFAVGMLAATVNFAPPWHRFAVWRERMPWGWLTAGLWALYLCWMPRQFDVMMFASTRYCALAGVAMLCTLVYCTRAAQAHRRNNLLLRLCELPAAVVLGTFSYSLYLIHAPILAMITLVLRARQVAGPAAVTIQIFVAVPLAAAVSYGFHLVAERPFLLGRPATLPPA